MRLALAGEAVEKARGKKHREDAIAGSAQLDGMYEHLHEALNGLGFFGTNNPDVVMRRLKGLFNRAATTQREVGIIRGICAAIQDKKRPR